MKKSFGSGIRDIGRGIGTSVRAVGRGVRTVGRKTKSGFRSMTRRVPRHSTMSSRSRETLKRQGTTRTQRSKRTLSTKRQGTIGRGTIGPLRKGKLTQYGYSTTSPARVRHVALDKAVKESQSPLSIYRGLNAVYVYNKNTQPEKSKIFKADRDYIRKRYF
jgi:hypothetical protein